MKSCQGLLKYIWGLTFLLIILLPSTAYALEYSNDVAQIKYTVPTGWSKEAMNKGREILKEKYINNDSGGIEVILFGYADVWGVATPEERQGWTREEFNNSIFSNSDIAEMYGLNEKSISIKTYNNVKYYLFSLSQAVTELGYSIEAEQKVLIRFHNGFLYYFSYAAPKGMDDHYSDFEEMVSSVKYLSESSQLPTDPVKQVSTVAGKSTVNNSSLRFSAESLLLSLILTISIYSLPIVIYRYGIRKKPVDSKKAKKITIIYGICSFIVMTIILYFLGNATVGGAIIFWSFINYRILISGIDKMSESDAKMTVNQVNAMKKEKNKNNENELDNISLEKAVDKTELIELNKNTENDMSEVFGPNKPLESTSQTIIEQIKTLSEFNAKGFLTNEEFVAAKKKLIGKL
ncbi:MAG: hypothetical protein ACOX8Q_09940 [Christensenellales bacterium]|jgi:hypothetical protein